MKKKNTDHELERILLSRIDSCFEHLISIQLVETLEYFNYSSIIFFFSTPFLILISLLHLSNTNDE